MIETNDSKLGVWHEMRFESEFMALAGQLRQHADRFIILIPPAVHFPKAASGKQPVRREIVNTIAEMEMKCCQEMNIDYIDLHLLTAQHPEW